LKNNCNYNNKQEEEDENEVLNDLVSHVSKTKDKLGN
jgi:predicted small metal-binding protein